MLSSDIVCNDTPTLEKSFAAVSPIKQFIAKYAMSEQETRYLHRSECVRAKVVTIGIFAYGVSLWKFVEVDRFCV